MSPHESQAIADLTDEIRGLREDFAVMHTKLFGDDDKETDKGRIPQLETRQTRHEKRLKRIERVGWMAAGVGWCVALIVAAVKAIYYTVGVVRH